MSGRPSQKRHPLYLNRISCHDPKVLQGISTGVGYRLRLTNSSNETFRENVELYSRTMENSGYNYQEVEKEMFKFEKIDPVEFAKRGKTQSKRKRNGCKAFFIAPFDPRLPHPRTLISKNYDLLARNDKAKALFPRENLIAASKRLKNLGEILSSTVQTARPGIGGGDGPATGMDVEEGEGGGQGRGGARARGRGGRRAPSQRLNVQQPPGGPTSSGSYHCQYQLKSGKCDVFGRMSESRSVLSSHFGVRHKIAGYNVHLQASQAEKYRWFIYLEECVHPEGVFQYVGSTDSMTH